MTSLALAVVAAISAMAGVIVGALSSDSFVAIVAAIMGGGLATAYVALRKAGPEVESIGVTTLRGVLEELREELKRKDLQIAELHRENGQKDVEIAELKRRVERLELGLDGEHA